jgi:SPP1 gp7 family putative phage head morphogenesis protein
VESGKNCRAEAVNKAKAIDALTRFLEADAGMAAERFVTRKAPALERKVATVFREQSRVLLTALRPFAPQFDANAARLREAIDGSDWLIAWQQADAMTRPAFEATLEGAILEALIVGGGQLFETLNFDGGEVGISWTLENPRAVAYAKQTAASRVSDINETTERGLRRLITSAVDTGQSYDDLSKAIGSKFKEFATGGDNPRSRRIAVFELGDAYEAGNEQVARQLQAAGLELEKFWLSVGDDKVRPEHRANQGEGWIEYDEPFGSGNMRPPTDPGCRCTLLTRRSRDPEVLRRQADEQAEWDRERIYNPYLAILPPPGRAPRGRGQEYADRRAIVRMMQTQSNFESQLTATISRWRGTRRDATQISFAKNRVQQIRHTLNGAMEVARWPGKLPEDWAFKREVIKDMIDVMRWETLLDA